MMKKTVYTLFVVCLSLLMAGTVSAQTCKSDWTFTAQPQESTCQANGVITVTMGGDMTNITGMQYSVSSTNGGRNVEPQPNNVIGNLPPATYTVTVRAFCAVDADYTVVKEQMNVVVPGTYQVPVATLNANSSRKSYADPNLSDPAFCGSGRIAIDVVKGSGNFTFEITAAPAGVTLGAITPTKSGASLYTLPGETYPAGAYTILVNDGCYTAACNFTLEGISGFPSLASTSQSVFYPTNINDDCHSLRLYTGVVSSTANADYYKYYLAGLYEVGVAPAGQVPTQWTTWNPANASSYYLTVNTGSYTVNDLRAGNIDVYTRVKGCEKAFSYFRSSMRTPAITASPSAYYCNNYAYRIYPTWNDYDDVLCYPLTVRVTEVGSSTPMYDKDDVFTSGATITTLEYGKAYTWELIDGGGYTRTGSISKVTRNPLRIEFGPDYQYNSYSSTYVVNDNFCNGTYGLYYRVPISTSSSINTSSYSSIPFFRCYPVELTVTDSQGTVVGTSVTYTGLNTTWSYYALFEYGETYTFTAVYKYLDSDGITELTEEYQRTFTRATDDGYPKSYSMTLPSTDNCSRGYFRVSTPYTASNDRYRSVYMPVGTDITITGPAGYTSQNTITTSATQYYFDFPTTDLPAGTYTATITYPCGTITPITTTYTVAYNIPTAYTLALYDTDNCIEDRGRFYIYRNNGSIPTGSTYTVTGPEGYTIQTGSLSSGTSSTYLPWAILPAGAYTLTIVHGCGGTEVTTLLNWNGVYSGRNLGYRMDGITCEGMKVIPTGYITYQGNNQTGNTFYRLTGGPDGYDRTVKKPGESFIFSAAGTYTLGVMYTNSTSGCVIKTITIEYDAPPLQLSKNETTAFVCVGGNTGVMSMRAINGVAPFTYQLYDETNTILIKTYDPAEYPAVDPSRAVFEYGSAGETYTIRVSDACGNKFKQQLTLTNLITARIVYTEREKYCQGDDIQLNCITLGQTTYSWTGPNGFTSNEQNPILTNVTPEMTGTYTVSVTPEFCGTPVTESVYVRVRPCFMPVNPNIHLWKE